MPVEFVHSPEAILADPVGRCLVGEHILIWRRDAGFVAVVAWGQPLLADLELFLAWLHARCGLQAPRLRSLLDLRRIQQLEPSHFERIFGLAQKYRARLAEVIIREAVLRPDGFIGAAIEGYFTIYTEPHPNKVFAHIQDALAWLGIPPTDPLERDLILLEESARRVPHLVEELRLYLRQHPQSATVGTAARALGVSTRTLQRKLQQAGVRFWDELHAVQVQRAQDLLRSTDLKLSAIAEEVGLRRPQQLSSLFHHFVGESPSQFRIRSRTPR